MKFSRSDFEMQSFESRRPNQPVRLKRVKYEGSHKNRAVSRDFGEACKFDFELAAAARLYACPRYSNGSGYSDLQPLSQPGDTGACAPGAGFSCPRSRL